MLIEDVFNSLNWNNGETFPSCPEWKNEINLWLEFINSKNQLNRYKKRLRDHYIPRRYEALAEILAAYYMEKKLNYPVIDWERITVNNKNVDFVIQNERSEIYCEVKSPGWEGQIKGQLPEDQFQRRVNETKYRTSECYTFDNPDKLKNTIDKAFGKFSIDNKNLLIICDDLLVPFLDRLWEINSNDIFSNDEYKSISGILFIDVRLTNTINYRYKFIENQNAVKPFMINKNTAI